MNLGGFSGVDIFIVILGLYFIVRGCYRGFIGEVITLVGFLAAFYLSFHYSSEFGHILKTSAGIDGYVAQAVGGLIIWVMVILLTAVVRMVLKSAVGAAHLGGIDKLLGFVSGAIKTIIAVYAILALGLLVSPVVNPSWMTQSDILRYAGRTWPQFRALIIGLDLIPEKTTLPDGTLEEILRPYRTGEAAPAVQQKTGGNTQ